MTAKAQAKTSDNSADPIGELWSGPHQLDHVVTTTSHWFATHWLQITISLVAGVLLYLAMTGIKRLVVRLHRHAHHPTDLRALIGRTAAKTTHFFMMMAAARLVAGYASPPAWLLTTISFLFTVIAVFQGAIWAREFVIGLIERRTGADGHGETLSNAMGLIRILVTFALFAIATVMVLDNIGVNVTGLVAGLGIGGIAIGLAAQGIFSDLFAALSIIFDRPFRQGDTIQYDTTTATVETIGLKSTKLRSVDGERKVISNAKLLEKEITNYADIAQRRYALPIGVIYQTPPELAARVPEILREAIESAGAAFVRAGFSGFGPSSLDYECFFLAHGHDIDAAVALRHKVGMAVLQTFAQEGLEFAYPTQTTFTAAPDGTMIYPFTRPQDAEQN
jgi:small-conductance mechanosensitive channel